MVLDAVALVDEQQGCDGVVNLERVFDVERLDGELLLACIVAPEFERGVDVLPPLLLFVGAGLRDPRDDASPRPHELFHRLKRIPVH